MYFGRNFKISPGKVFYLLCFFLLYLPIDLTAASCHSTSWSELRSSYPWGIPGGKNFTYGGYNWRTCFNLTGNASPYTHTWKTSTCGGTAHYLSRTQSCSDGSAPTDIHLSNNSVNENSNLNTGVGTLSATDLQGGTMSYSISSGSAYFNISGVTLRTSQVFDYEGVNSYPITIQVTDSDNFQYSKDFTINILDVNESPTDISLSQATLIENAVANTTVGSLATIDPEGGMMTYEIISGGTYFNLNDNVLQSSLPFNYENSAAYPITIKVTDNGGLSFTKSFEIVIRDVNEAPILTSPAHLDVPENTSAVQTVTATDVDAGTTLTYSLTGGADQAKFAINGSTGALTFISAPNYEIPTDADTDNVYEVEVRVTDDGSVNLSDSQTLFVSVTNVNEAPFLTSPTNLDVPENTIAVQTVTATDVDAGNTLTYSLTGGADQAKFAMNGSTGALTFISAPDFEVPSDVDADNVYEVEVRVTDDGVVNLSDSQTLFVSVTDINEAPILTSPSHLDVPENTTSVLTVTATDVDARTTLTYSLTGGADQSRFSIDGTTGALIFVSTPDFEVPSDVDADNVYEVEVSVTDDGSVNLSDSQTLFVSVTDINEAPIFTSSAHVDVPENTTSVQTVTATDVDAGTTLTYSITGGPDVSHFSINGSTGALNFILPPDFEAPGDMDSDNIYEVEVGVADDGLGALTDTQIISVSVVNVNESPSIVASSLRIKENSLANTPVEGELLGHDVDGDALRWTLVADPLTHHALFFMDSLTGTLSLKADSTLNYEREDTLWVLLSAHDGSLSTQLLTHIVVVDVNDAPVINDQTLTLIENSPAGVALDTVLASDEDSADTLSYSFVSDHDLFVIDSQSGAISIKPGAVLDFEVQSNHSIEVVVNDGEYSDTALVSIEVENVIETAKIELLEIFDDEGRSTLTTDFYTSKDSVFIVLLKDDQVDTVIVSVEEGVNLIKQVNEDPTKDVFEEVNLRVVVSTTQPILEVVTTDSVPVDESGVYYINDLKSDSMWVQINFINELLEEVTFDSLIALEEDLIEGEIVEMAIAYEDPYGNVGSIVFEVLLDTTFPILTLITPEDRSITEYLEADVTWVVYDDGDTLNFQELEVLANGFVKVTRSYSDFAGNTASDHHYLRVDAKDSGAKIKPINRVVERKTEEQIIEYFENRDRASDPVFDNLVLDDDLDGIPDYERANVSVILPHARHKAVELAVQTDKGIINRTTFEEFELDKRDTRFGLFLELQFPINGGTSRSGSERSGMIPEDYFNELADELGWLDDIEGDRAEAIQDSIRVLCDGDSTIWKLRVEGITFHIFDNLGQFVSKLRFEGFDILDPSYQDDQGKVTLELELPQLKDGFKADGGVNWGSGVYITSGSVRTSATPRACLEHIQTLRKRVSRTNILVKSGYKKESF